MGKKLTKVYEALVRGLTDGLHDHELYDFVQNKCTVSSHERIRRASTLAMSDPRIHDRDALERIYSIAIDRHTRCSA